MCTVNWFSVHVYCKLVFCTLVLQVQAPVCASDSSDLVSGVPGWAVVLISLAVALNVGVLVFLVTRYSLPLIRQYLKYLFLIDHNFSRRRGRPEHLKVSTEEH